MCAQQRRRRRPKADYGRREVVVERGRCLVCGATALRVVRSQYRDLHGVVDGVPFTRVRWQWCRCGACGQAVRVRSREFDPSVWRGPLPVGFGGADLRAGS